MFSLEIEFLARTAVMTHHARRDSAEWPPHPARIFMAMAAAHYESKPLPEDGESENLNWSFEVKALEWLESLGAPLMSWPEVSRRTIVSTYVPVNDASVTANPNGVRESDLRGALNVMPAVRSRQERTFPTVFINGEEPDCFVALLWPDANASEQVRLSIEAITSKVTRIGHSSSLVRIWVSSTRREPQYRTGEADRGSHSVRLRIPAPGFLRDLEQRYNNEEIESYFELADAIDVATGKNKKLAKAALASRFPSLLPPLRSRPAAALTASYCPILTHSSTAHPGPFDRELFILAKMEGPVLGLESTAAVTDALRGLLLKNVVNFPEWYTGHGTDGSPSTSGHLALFPLSYVGAEHSDGHIMGVAIAIPRHISIGERAEYFKSRLFDTEGQPTELTLTMGKIGVWTLLQEDRPAPPRALKSETWTGPSRVWTSVTPVVLDRHTKFDYLTERQRWHNEVSQTITQSCILQKLPAPNKIELSTVSFLRGAPSSKEMPLLNSKRGLPPRRQIHVRLSFGCEVEGPVLLGAGRFRGYGLFKPTDSGRS